MSTLKDSLEKLKKEAEEAFASWVELKEMVAAETEDEEERPNRQIERIVFELASKGCKGKRERQGDYLDEKQKKPKTSSTSCNVRSKMSEAEAKKEEEEWHRLLTKVVLMRFSDHVCDEYAVPKRKRSKIAHREKGIKNCPKTLTVLGREEHYLARKKTPQQKNKKKCLQKRSDPMAELVAAGLEPPPDMPEVIKNLIAEMGGTEINLVCQKIIENTDLEEHYNRLAMSLKQVRYKFLSEAEERRLNNGGMEVTLIEPCLHVSQVQLGKWQIGSNFAYVFKKQWGDVVENNADSLKWKAIFQIWSFRFGEDSSLGFALVKVRDGIDTED